MAFSVAFRERPPRTRHAGFRPTIPVMSVTPRPEEETTNRDVPYRLPRLSKDGDQTPVSQSADDLKVWSRHGYDVYSSKPIDLIVMSSQPNSPTRARTGETRRSQPTPSSFPKFRQAMITPSQSQPKLYAGNVTDPAFYRNAFLHHTSRDHVNSRPDLTQDPVSRPDLTQSPGPQLPDIHFDPSPTPVPGQYHGQFHRSPSPAKSVKSIHWTLSPVRNQHFDKKGGGRIQGPYSREFVRKCSAPNNWMKMKWGRSKTTMV